MSSTLFSRTEFDASRRPCRCCRERKGFERIDGRDSAFGESVAFDQQQANRVEELCEIGGKRGGAGDGGFIATTERRS